MSTENEFLQPEALARLQSEAAALPAAIEKLLAATAALTDVDDDDQLDARDAAATELQLALARLNAAEYDYSGEMSFWPADDDEGYDYDDEDDDDEDDEDEDREGSEEEADVEVLSVVARVDLLVRDPSALKAQAMAELMVDGELTTEEADQFSDSPLQAAQALLPDVAERLEEAFADVADVAWVYAGVSAGEFDRDEDGFEDILEDDDHRAFYVEIFETEEEARAAAAAAGVDYAGEDDWPESADGDAADGGADGGGGE